MTALTMPGACWVFGLLTGLPTHLFVMYVQLFQEVTPKPKQQAPPPAAFFVCCVWSAIAFDLDMSYVSAGVAGRFGCRRFAASEIFARWICRMARVPLYARHACEGVPATPLLSHKDVR